MDIFTREWIIRQSVDIISQYERGVLTIRGLHYRLVAAGMTNTLTHYKRVVAAMIEARWAGTVSFDAFSDHDRSIIGSTNIDQTDLDSSVEQAKESIQGWMNYYFKNRWENQPVYPEVFIEKKALQGVFEKVTKRNGVALGACKGYPSLTFLKDTARRFVEAVDQGKRPVILYFGDYDPSGEDIPRSIQENIEKLGCPEIEVIRIALMKEQVVAWKLPPAPIKEGDSRSAGWDGLGQVELDAVEPEKLRKLCQKAIDAVFNEELHNELKEAEEEEQTEYRIQLKKYVSNL